MKIIRKIFNIPKDIEIDWSYPKLISTVINEKELFNWGIYQITTKTNEIDDLLYIGKAWLNFNDRIKDHNKKWLDFYDGDKYVRLGRLNTKVKEKELLEIESAIIFELKPIQNIKSTQTYSPSDEYDIYSIGYRGQVPKLIKTKEH